MDTAPSSEGFQAENVSGASAKRLVDLLLSVFMIFASAPIFLVIAVLIKLEDGGPVFFYQERWGQGGKLFSVRKFRTMVQNAGLRQATINDSRITRVGRYLRAAGLDELPQILNIFKGEMSFVGPRPLAIGEIIEGQDGCPIRYEEIPGFSERLSVLPGLTSLATVFIPKDSHPRRKFRYDLIYVRKRSLRLDLKLIFMSYWISFRGNWETRDSKILSAEPGQPKQRVVAIPVATSSPMRTSSN